jgi:hypothetical protein
VVPILFADHHRKRNPLRESGLPDQSGQIDNVDPIGGFYLVERHLLDLVIVHTDVIGILIELRRGGHGLALTLLLVEVMEYCIEAHPLSQTGLPNERFLLHYIPLVGRTERLEGKRKHVTVNNDVEVLFGIDLYAHGGRVAPEGTPCKESAEALA